MLSWIIVKKEKQNKTETTVFEIAYLRCTVWKWSINYAVKEYVCSIGKP